MSQTDQQQLAFEQTRARIEANVFEIRRLAQSSVDPAEFFPKFVELAVACLNARGAALWYVNPAGRFDQVAEQEFASLMVDENEAQKKTIETLLAKTAQGKQPCIVAAADAAAQAAAAVSVTSAPNEIKNITPYPVFFIPVLQNEQVAMVFQLWMPEAGDPKAYRDILAFLVDLSTHVGVFLKNHQGAVVAHSNQELQTLVRMQASMMGQLEIRELCAILANYTSDLLRADLVCVFRRRQGRKWKLEAASNQEVVDTKSHHVMALTALANSLPLSDKAVAYPNEDTEEDLRSLFGVAAVEHAAARPAGEETAAKAEFFVMAIRNEGSAFGASGLGLLNRICEAAGKCLEAASHHHHLPVRPLLALASRARRDWQTGHRRRVLFWASIPAGLMLIFFAVPVPLKITANCAVRPHFRAVSVAEVPGRVAEVMVSEGQVVTAGEVLARMDDREYITQLAVLEQQRLRWEVEAARAQANGNEAERKLAQLSARREEETIRRIEYMRDRTLIRSPIDGVVLSKNLHNREGEFFETGKVFAEIASADQFEVVLDIRQRDIGQLLRALEQQGTLPLRFVLHSHASQQLEATIESGLDISQTPEVKPDGSYFQAVINFPPDSPLRGVLKPGYTGKAKIRIGTTNLAYSLTRPFINIVRVELGL